MALACDYDGTLATEGRVGTYVLDALKQFKASGRRLILVTGRMLSDLFLVFGHENLFDCIVAENGAVIYHPLSNQHASIAEKPSESFVAALREKEIHPLWVGEVIIATYETFEEKVLETIREHKLNLQLIKNKGALMILPEGVNKQSGLQFALVGLGISNEHLAAVGDGENDIDLLSCCKFAVAVENAVPSLKSIAHFVTQSSEGEGVAEVIQHILKSDAHI